MQDFRSDWKAEILRDFAVWLTDLPPQLPDEQRKSPEVHALADLFSEVAALRREVAFQNRSGKTAQVAVESATAVVAGLGKELKTQLAAFARASARPASGPEVPTVIASFLEIRDALVRTEAVAARLISPEADRRDEVSASEGLVEALQLVLRKFDRILQEHRISRIDAVGRPFDPSIMSAAGTSSVPDLPDGTVVEEVRGGFLYDGRLLRTAQVFVNRCKEEQENENEQ